MKNFLETSSFYTCAPKITITRGTVPEIRSETDKMFCRFGPFFALLPPPTNDAKYQNFEKKKKKMPGDIIPILSLYMCTINDDHMIYGA